MTFEPSNDIYVLTLKEDDAPAGAPRPLLATDGSQVFARRSRRTEGWIAYRFVSNPATGRTDVYLARFPEGTKRVQISDNGGGTPFWSHKKMSSSSPGSPGVMQSVDITLGERVQVGTPRTLFTVGIWLVFGRAGWQPVPRDQKAGHRAPANMVIVQHWLDELRRIVPVK